MKTFEETVEAAVVEDIKKRKEELKQLERELKELKKERKQQEKVPLIQTLPVRACLHATRFISAPFHRLYMATNMAYEAPELVQFQRLIDKIHAVLKEAEKVSESDEEKKRKKMAKRIIETIWELEKNSYHSEDIEEYRDLLVDQLNRIVPPEERKEIARKHGKDLTPYEEVPDSPSTLTPEVA